MDLPEPLAPWAAQLSIFPRDLALSVGPLLRRLAPAIGPLDPYRHGTLGEMDGFDGLTHRGSYERLLMTEWLLADEAPDEFLRRAAAMEHTFLRPARPEPGGARTSIAVFDAGPSQLGSPRLVHVAALLVLHRRALAAGVRFAWSVLQEPEGSLWSELDPAAVLRLLDSRRPQEATDDDLERWRRRVAGWRDLDDFWVVGSRRLAASAASLGASWLVVRDVLEPATRTVAAAVQRKGTVGTEVVLDLPAEPVCARLLRDPFSAAFVQPHRTEARFAPVSNLVFSGSGLQLFARARSGGILQYKVPNSPRMTTGPARLFFPHTGKAVLAVGRVGKQIAALTARGPALELHSASARRAWRFEIAPPAAGLEGLAESESLGPCLGAGAGPSRLGIGPCAALLGGRVLVHLTEEAGRSVAIILSAHTLALGAIRDGMVHVSRSPSGTHWEAVSRRTVAPRQVVPVSDQEDVSVFLGFGGGAAHPELGLMAVSREPGVFQVWHAKGTSRIALPEGARAVGVSVNLRRGEAGMIALEGDGRTLLQVGQAWTRRLQRAAAPVDHVAVSPAASSLAYSTTAGELVIFALERDSVLYQASPTG